jgi:hypothetical protein
MVKVSEFFGISVLFWFNDHPPPHFHAQYAGLEVEIQIDPIGVRAGYVPPRVISMLLEWTALHQEELLACWAMARQQQRPPMIEPLD